MCAFILPLSFLHPPTQPRTTLLIRSQSRYRRRTKSTIPILSVNATLILRSSQPAQLGQVPVSRPGDWRMGKCPDNSSWHCSGGSKYPLYSLNLYLLSFVQPPPTSPSYYIQVPSLLCSAAKDDAMDLPRHHYIFLFLRTTDSHYFAAPHPSIHKLHIPIGRGPFPSFGLVQFPERVPGNVQGKEGTGEGKSIDF